MRKKPQDAPVQKVETKEMKKDESVKFITTEDAKAESVIEEKKADVEVKPTKKPEPVPETICGRHLKTVDDLKSFPIFKDGERGSLLSKYLTEDVWKQLHDKEDSLGVSFKTCIMSGCQNTDSGIGVYAGSPDSYTAFS